jgi:hypothetical protein
MTNSDTVVSTESLIRKIQPLVEPLGIRKDTLTDAFKESLKEIERDGCSVHPWLLPLVFWKIFDAKGFLLIDQRTPAGNAILFDVMTTAYAMWRDAERKAAFRGMDELDASDALIHVVHILSDRHAAGKGRKIRNIRRYMFAVYSRVLTRLAEKLGIGYRKIINPLFSDDGDFVGRLENTMFCDEVTKGLSAKEEDAAGLRYVMGCSCEETAERMGMSNCAARKLVSRALKKCSKHAGGKSGHRVIIN